MWTVVDKGGQGLKGVDMALKRVDTVSNLQGLTTVDKG